MPKSCSLQVDIISACLNSEQYLSEMIESVLNQDYPRIELFIQDGGSTDGTFDILRRYPIRWESEPDNGISQALNRAIAATRGEVIGFTSTDDLLQPRAVNAAVQVFNKRPEIVMVYGDCHLMDLKRLPFKLWRSRPFDLDKLFWENYIPYQTVYVRRKALKEVGYFDEDLKLVQDWDLWIRLGAHFPAECFKYIPRIQGQYLFHDNTAGWDMEEVTRCLTIVAKKFFNNEGMVAHLEKGKSQAIAGVLLNISIAQFAAGYTIKAWKTYKTAIQVHPKALFMKKGLFSFLRLVFRHRFWSVSKRMQKYMSLRSVTLKG